MTFARIRWRCNGSASGREGQNELSQLMQTEVNLPFCDRDGDGRST